jgi:hypothetical protein
VFFEDCESEDFRIGLSTDQLDALARRAIEARPRELVVTRPALRLVGADRGRLEQEKG